MSSRRTLFAGAFLLASNLAIVGLAWLFRQTVAPDWKKGPLIDPASPYSPENAMVLFAFAACIALDVYFLSLAVARSRGLRRAGPWLAMALALGVSELGVRAWLAVDMVTYFRPHPTLHWVVRSNLKDFGNLKGGGVITTNADGMREVTVPREKAPGEYRVLVLGDSSNFGHGVEGDEMWSSVLHDLVPRLTVLNGATPGWTTFQAVQFLRETGLAYHPDLVIAGFNNDPGPEYMADSARVLPPIIQSANRVLFRLETYLLSREVLLSMVRHANARYTARKAGDEPLYGKLSADEAAGLVPRVPLNEFEANLRTLAEMSPKFAWIDMPINRSEPELVERYVNPEYRAAAERIAKEVGYTFVDVDERWLRTREPGNFQAGHVFHPNAQGHRRMAEQIAQEMFEPTTVIHGPPAAATEATLRFGISSLTPVHAHVLAVLQAMPELAAKHGLTLEITAYPSGKQQGDDVRSGALDAWFTCEVPAIPMLVDRPDARAVAAPGELGRVAVVGRAASLADLRGKKVGFVQGSTPAMDWRDWGRAVGATDVNVATDQQFEALEKGDVDAIVGWDPWVADWLRRDPTLHVLESRSFRSILAVSVPWSTYEPGRASRLIDLVKEALEIAAADRPKWDAEVARISGWPIEVVRAVADQNVQLSGGAIDLSWEALDSEGLARALRFASPGRLQVQDLVGMELLQGQWPRPRSDAGGKGPGGPGGPGRMPPGGPQGPPNPGPGQGPPQGPPNPGGGR